jgi:hypothetical protein
VKVAVEASNLYGLLTSLRFRVEGARSDDPWFNQAKLLSVENGPLDQFKVVLEKMMEKISLSRKRGQVRSALTWKFTELEVDNTLQQMERLKFLITCVLIENVLWVSWTCQATYILECLNHAWIRMIPCLFRG